MRYVALGASAAAADRQGKFNVAADANKQALAGLQKTLPPNHRDIIVSEIGLIRRHILIGKPQEVAQLAAKTLDKSEAGLGGENIYMLVAGLELAWAEIAKGNIDAGTQRQQ